MTDMHFRVPSTLSPADVWPFIADFQSIHRISPLVRRTTLMSPTHDGVGAERICHMDMGMGLRERVTDWKEGESYSIEILKMSMAPIRDGKATLGVRPRAEGSEIFMKLSYTHRFGPLGWVMDPLMTRPMMSVMMTWFLRTIDRRIRDGLARPRLLASTR